MSYSKRDQVFPPPKRRITEDDLASMIGVALRVDYGDLTSAIKHIGLQTGAHLRAIKNWFSGRNTPSSSHLLILARISPSVLRIVLEQVGGADLFDAFEVLDGSKFTQKSRDKNVPINVLLNPDAANLNERQVWFLTGLKRGLTISALDISDEFSVSLKTAQRDIGALKIFRLVGFTGSRKNGRYKLI